MTLAKTYSVSKLDYLLTIKTFLFWSFILIVCFLVVGFPLFALMVTAGSLLAIALHSVLPVSAVLLVAGSLIGVNALAIGAAAALLTLKGVHPQEVSWLSWLRTPGQLHTAIYAACPLTCDMKD